MFRRQESRKTVSFDWQLWLRWVLASTLGWVLAIVLVGNISILFGLVLGLFQWFVLRSIVSQAGWWILATGVGWVIGNTTAILFFPSETLVLSGAVVGVMMGGTQWLALRRWFPGAVWWVAISLLGWAVAPILGVPLVGAVAGATTGVTLELMARTSEQ